MFARASYRRIAAPVLALVLVAVLVYLAVRALVGLPRRAVDRGRPEGV
jgi:hypothetical protein